MRKCKHCNEELSSGHKGLSCSVCRMSLNRYGLNRLDIIAMHESQGGKCALCSKEVTMFNRRQSDSGYIDHCHSTGKVRAILCHPCNTSLGYIENNLDLNRVKEYLQS